MDTLRKASNELQDMVRNTTYSVGQHVPKPIRDHFEEKGLMYTVGTCMIAMVIPPVYYAIPVAAWAWKGSEVTNDIEDRLKE